MGPSVAANETIAAAGAIRPQPSKKGRSKDNKTEEDSELNSLLAELDATTEKENPVGMSKAAAKRAKKKAKEADGAAPASSQDADERAEKPAESQPEPEAKEVDAVDDNDTAGKSAEEVKALLKLRAEAAAAA